MENLHLEDGLLRHWSLRKLLCTFLEHKTRNCAEQGKLPCGSTGTSSGNCQETETCMVWSCYTPRQPLQNHPSGHPGRWVMPWLVEEMLDGQHQRVDIPAHARTAHMGSCRWDWKRISAKLSTMSPWWPNRSRDWTELKRRLVVHQGYLSLEVSLYLDVIWRSFSFRGFHTISCHRVPMFSWNLKRVDENDGDVCDIRSMASAWHVAKWCQCTTIFPDAIFCAFTLGLACVLQRGRDTSNCQQKMPLPWLMFAG